VGYFDTLNRRHICYLDPEDPIGYFYTPNEVELLFFIYLRIPMDIILKPIMKGVKNNGFEPEAHIRKIAYFFFWVILYHYENN
jgi:hypothetical protein